MFGFTRDRTKDILDKYLDGDFYIAACGEPPPLKSRFTEAGKRLGCAFPKEFLAHSTNRYGGVYIEVKEEIWPRAKEFEVAPFWTFLYGTFVYGLGDEIPDWMNLETAATEFRESTGHKVVPCLKVIGDADIYCFDAAGKIVRWNHETDELEPFAGDFFALLDHEVRELRERKDRKLAPQ